MKQTRKEKLAYYISTKSNRRMHFLFNDYTFAELCEIVEFELEENIFDVFDKLNIKYDKSLRTN